MRSPTARADVAAPLLDRLLETTPLPVVIVQLHRRLRELLIAGRPRSRRAADPPRSSRRSAGTRTGRRSCVEQARRWSLPELDAALEGVLELDAMIKGAVDPGSTERQVQAGVHALDARPRGVVGPRRLVVLDRRGTLRWQAALRGSSVAAGSPVAEGRRSGAASSVGGGPGLLLEHDVALDREHAAALAEVEQLDQLRIDVQLVAVLAQAARDPEAQPLGPVGQPERRVEAGDDEAPAAARAAISQARHRGFSGGADPCGRRPATDARSGLSAAGMTQRYRSARYLAARFEPAPTP